MGEGGGDGGRGMEGECEAGRKGRGFGRCGEDEGMEVLKGLFSEVGKFPVRYTIKEYSANGPVFNA